MNHDKATEEFFRLRGWKNIAVVHYDGVPVLEGHMPHQQEHEVYCVVPNICESMTGWIKYVAEFMEGENLTFECMDGEARWWDNDNEVLLSKEIKDHQILLASVLAAIEYWKGKK